MDICETCGHRFGEGSEIVVHPSVAGQRAALAQIDAEILQFKAHIATLEAKRRVVAENLALVVYPVLTLPAEITSCVFVECLPPHGRVRPSLRQAPLSISQVCRHCREIALSIGELWSSLDMLFSIEQGDQKADLVETWLSRSSGRTLSWTIRPSRLKTPDIPPICPNDLARVWRLEANLTREHFQKLRPLHTPLPRLRSLAANLALEDLRDVMQCAPELRELYIVDFAPSANLASQTLVRLEICDSVPLDMFLSILNNCPRLLSFRLHRGVQSTVPNLTPTTFPNLRSLAIGTSLDALQLVTLPNLVCLEAWASLNLDVLHPFLSRSSCAIQELHFGDILSTQALTAQLKLIPSVQKLAVYVYHDTLDYLLDCLDPDDMFLLPHLREITLWMESDSPFDFWKIINVLCRRRNAVNMMQLQSVLLRAKDQDSDSSSTWWRIPDAVATEIRRVNACGLKLAIWVEFCDLDEDFILTLRS